jgi:hypothetical protein
MIIKRKIIDLKESMLLKLLHQAKLGWKVKEIKIQYALIFILKIKINLLFDNKITSLLKILI